MSVRVYLDGEYLAEAEASVPVTDRGFLLGDSVFETLRTAGGRPLLWEAHLARLLRGLGRLGIQAPVPPEALRSVVTELPRHNGLPDAVVRITVTRGSGPRGYSARGAGRPTLLVTAHPAPPAFGGLPPGEGWRLVTSRHRLPPPDALSDLKHGSRALWVLARLEADAAGADEALLLGADGTVAEATASNLAWWVGEELHTPGPATGALPGVMLEAVLEAHRAQGGACRESRATPGQLLGADGVFLTNSVHLVVPVAGLDGRPVAVGARTPRLQALLRSQGLC